MSSRDLDGELITRLSHSYQLLNAVARALATIHRSSRRTLDGLSTLEGVPGPVVAQLLFTAEEASRALEHLADLSSVVTELGTRVCRRAPDRAPTSETS